MIVNPSFSDIAKKIQKINRESYLVKVCVIVTARYVICVDTDNQVEFFRFYHENLKAFLGKLIHLYYAMLEYDYSDIGKIRPNQFKRTSKKLYELWKEANQKKSLILSLRQSSQS